MSLNTTNTKGVILNTRQKSYTGRVNADANINQWVKIGTNTSFTYTEDNVPSDNVFNKSLWANPMIDYAPYEADATRHLRITELFIGERIQNRTITTSIRSTLWRFLKTDNATI